MTKVYSKRAGAEFEAFDLIMRKEYAWQILKGEKLAEYRTCSDFYIRRFVADVKNWRFKPIFCVHFHDYANTWYLDVACTVALATVHEDERWVFERYKDAEFLAMIDENDKSYEDSTPIFILPIGGIIGTNLATETELEQMGVKMTYPVVISPENAVKWDYDDAPREVLAQKIKEEMGIEVTDQPIYVNE